MADIFGKVLRALDSMKATYRKLAASQAKAALADAVLTLIARGQPMDMQALISELLTSVQDLKPDDNLRVQREAAAELLGWRPTPVDERTGSTIDRR